MATKTTYPSAACGYMRYPPSILLVAAKTPEALELQRILETKGCQLYWTEPNFEALSRASQKYFELIVLALDRATADDLALYQKLKSFPELAITPMVILATYELLDERINEFRQRPVYFLPKDPCAVLILLSIIEQVHYMTHRYLS